jgi:hypothetical protein
MRDRELYLVIALDAKGVPERRITAKHAAGLLANAAIAHAATSAAATSAVASAKSVSGQ